MAVETFRIATADEIKVQMIRGTAVELVFTVLGPNGLPKDMSDFAGTPPIIKFKNKKLSEGGTIGVYSATPANNTGIAQALNIANDAGICEWLDGGVGGQIHARIPTVPFADTTPGTRLASALPAWTKGVFSIQATSTEDLTDFGGPGSVANVQTVIRGTWQIDDEVTNI